MKNIMMIDSYLNGSLSNSELQEFERQIEKDPILLNEINLHKEVNAALSDEEILKFRSVLKEVIIANRDTSNSKLYRSTHLLKFAVAASIIFLVVTSLWKLATFASPEKLYAEFYNPYIGDFTTRSGVQINDKLQLSLLLYQEGDFETSYEMLSNYIQKNNNSTALFYHAMCALELNKPNVAVEQFLKVENDPYATFSLHARWYLALTYLKLDDKTNAREFFSKLADEENMYSEKAKKILRTLGS